MKEFASFLGLVFEGAFKLGFLKRWLPADEYEKLADGIFGHIIGKVRVELKEPAFEGIIEELRRIYPQCKVDDPPEGLRELSKLMTTGNDLDEGRAFTKFIFALGYSEGFFYGKEFEGIKLMKFHMGEETGDVTWRNADLVFIDNKGVLHIVDFKLMGAFSQLSDIIEKKNEPVIPITVRGTPLNLSLGELEFSKFVEKLISVRKELEESEEVFVEEKGFLQLVSYALDYLMDSDNTDEIRGLSLELLYPFPEPLRISFHISNKKDLGKYHNEMKNLYKSLRDKEADYEKILKLTDLRKRMLKSELPKKIEGLKKEMAERESNVINVKPADIRGAREDVREKLSEFLKRDDKCKAIVLLHSAGSGKTSVARELILGLEGKHIVLYMSSRVKLLKREFKKVEERKRELGESGKYIVLLERTRKSRNERGIIHGGKGFQEGARRLGFLGSAVDDIVEVIKREKPDQVWTFQTLQSVVETVRGHRTSEYLDGLLRPTIIRDYQIHIILDEIFGYKNGLFVVKEAFKFAKKAREANARVNIYIFDANGFSPTLFHRLLMEYDIYEVVPESIAVVYEPDIPPVIYMDIPLEIYAKHGYPAVMIQVHRKFMRVPKEDAIAGELAQYIERTFTERESRTAFAFIQDKELIAKLTSELKSRGFRVSFATANSKITEEVINRGNDDVILGTSSISRGLDFSRPEKPVDYVYVVVPGWGIESNLVEIIQSIARMRGDENTERSPKRLHLVYIINEGSVERGVENILKVLEQPDLELAKLVYEKRLLEDFLDLDLVVVSIIEQFVAGPGDRVLVPIPTQYRSVFVENKISELESVVDFLEDIRIVERNMGDKDVADKIYELEKLLVSSTSINTTIGRKFENLRDFEYYHPYLLLKKHQVILESNIDKERALSLLREVRKVLERHEEEKAERVEEFIKSLAPRHEISIPLLVPVYSIVLTKSWLREGEYIKFKLRKRAGRGHANVLGGGLELMTRCRAGSIEEYACIPLSEDYPYVEVLSGRFAKFPIKFVRTLLR